MIFNHLLGSTRNRRRVPHYSYIVVIQNDRIMPDCFRLGKFTIHNGSTSVWKLSSKGDVLDLVDGTVFNGEFHKVGE